PEPPGDCRDRGRIPGDLLPDIRTPFRDALYSRVQTGRTARPGGDPGGRRGDRRRGRSSLTAYRIRLPGPYEISAAGPDRRRQQYPLVRGRSGQAAPDGVDLPPDRQ